MSNFFRIFALCQILTSVPVFSDRIALLVIDVQNCFLPTGNLPVTDGDHVIPVINDIRRKYGNLFSLVVFSQDWHCVDHVSFASQHSGKAPYDNVILQYNNEGTLCDPTSQCNVEYNISQVLWPDHCVKNTASAEFAPNITRENSDVVVRKGYHCKIDSYSAFFDNGGFSHTELNSKLKESKISTVIVTGLALDYCVFYTAKDAKKLGYNVYVVKDATRGVANSSSDDALEDMNNRGIHIVQSRQLDDIMDELTSLANVVQNLNCFWYIVNFVITIELVHSLAPI